MPLKPSDRLASLDACPKGITESPSKKHSRHTNCRQPQAPEPPGSLLFSRWHQVTTSCYPIVHLSCPAHLIPLLYQPILLTLKTLATMEYYHTAYYGFHLLPTFSLNYHVKQNPLCNYKHFICYIAWLIQGIFINIIHDDWKHPIIISEIKVYVYYV